MITEEKSFLGLEEIKNLIEKVYAAIFGKKEKRNWRKK